MDWRILGPLEVWDNGSPINLGGRQRRLVLGVLLANAHETVSTDRMIEEVWAGSAPDSARKTIQAHVAHLRKVLNRDSEFLAGSGHGYQLSPEPGSIDADRFESAVGAARESQSGDPGSAVRLFDEALAMFRGEPYAGLADDALAVKVEAARLTELRLNAREDRLEALLSSGSPAEAAAAAERMLAEHPLRERLWGIQMLALYRAGRQSEALRAYSRARQTLAEELGIEPSSSLRALEQQILEQDESLSESRAAMGAQSALVDVRRNPYKGLRAFDEVDAGDFFGRGELVRTLVDRITSRPPAPLTVIAGPSGAGKSSVLRAGLVPVLRESGLSVAIMFPGDDPQRNLDQALEEASSDVEQAEPVVVDVVAVDQFEELFTQAPAEAVNRFISRVTDEFDPTQWVLTVRADFLGDLLAHPELGRELQESLVLVAPLENHEVEVAIVEPGRRVGVEVEPALIAAVIREVQARASSLPLMQYALTDLFERRRGRVLTLDAFERAGGLAGALVRRADEVFQRLTVEGKKIARQVFLQLVTVADNGEFARRRVDRDSLEAEDPDVIRQIVEQFGSQRLLTFDQDPVSGQATVELAHESLLDVWPRLSSWVDEAREELVMRSTLNTALSEWEVNDRDPSFLLAGGRLAQHESWTAETDLLLSETEIEYLADSRRHEDLDRARRRRRRIGITAGFGLAAVVAIVVGGLALQQNNRARATERVTQVVDLAGAAVAQLDIDPELGLLLALEAVDSTRRVDGTTLDVAEEALHRAVLADRARGTLAHNGEGIAHFSPDGELFVTASDRDSAAQIWSVDPFEPTVDLRGHTDRLIDAVFDPSGEVVATTSEDGTVRIWDVATGERRALLNVLGPATSPPVIPVFSNDGTRLAVTTFEDTVVMWDLDADGEPTVLPVPRGNDTLNLEFSPDDSLLAVSRFTGEDDVGPLLFEVATGELVASWAGHDVGVSDVGFTPDGSLLVTSGEDGLVKVWDADSAELLGTFNEHQGPVADLQISSDGTLVASSGEVDVFVWSLDTQEVVAKISGHDGRVDGIDISPDMSLLLTSSTADQTTRLWGISPHASHELIGLPGPSGVDGSIAFRHDGQVLAASTGPDQFTLWDHMSGEAIQTFDAGGAVYRMDFDDNDSFLAIGGESGTSILDVGTGEFTRLSGPLPDDIFLDRSGVDFGAGGVLAMASGEGVRIWDAPYEGSGRFIPTEGSLAVSFDPTGELFAATGPIGLLVFEVGGVLVKDLYPATGPQPPWIYSVAWHHDRPLMVTGGNDADVVLWSTATLDQIVSLKGHSANVLDVAFHPTTGDVVSASADGTVRFWNVDTGLSRMVLPAPGSVSDLAISADGRYLAVIGADGFVTVYILDVDELMAEAESRLTRWWTETECQQYLDSDTCPEAPEHLREDTSES